MTTENAYQALERTLCIPSDVTQLATVQSFIKELLGNTRYSQDELEEILLAVQEGVTNAIHHGNGGTTSCEGQILMKIFETHLEVKIRDQGNGFDPSRLDDPRLPQHRLKSKGRGIMFIQNFMDEVCFECNDDYHELKMNRFR